MWLVGIHKERGCDILQFFHPEGHFIEKNVIVY